MEKCSEDLIVIHVWIFFLRFICQSSLRFLAELPGLADILSCFFRVKLHGHRKERKANQQILAPIDGATAIYALISLFSY